MSRVGVSCKKFMGLEMGYIGVILELSKSAAMGLVITF